MPSSLLIPLAASAITSGVSFGASKLFGGGSGDTSGLQPQNFTPAGINAGGLNSSFQGGNINVSPDAARTGLVNNLASQFGDQAAQLNALRGSVAPGISALRSSRLGEIESARQASIGNLRENLARRRVLGSSFGQDAITRAESEFAGQRDKVAAESFLQELEASNQLINQQFNATRLQFQTGLDELNLEADVATKIGAKATETLGANARTLAALNAQEAAGAGKFFGQTFDPLFKQIGSSAAGLFKGGGDTVGVGGVGASGPSLGSFITGNS